MSPRASGGGGGPTGGARVTLIHVSDEVRETLAAGQPVVALETTLVAHGFPAPQGVEVGLASERRVRAAGAVPGDDRRPRRPGSGSA